MRLPTSKPEIDSLIDFGILVESLTYPNLTTIKALSKVLGSPGIFNLTELTGKQDAEERVASLVALLPTLPHDVTSGKYIAGYWTITMVAVASVALRIYARRKYSGKIRTEDKWAIAAAICSTCTAGHFTFTQIWASACHHIYDVSFDHYKRWIMNMAFGEVFFAFCLIPVKIVFLIFYHSLSPDRTYRRILVFVGFCVVAITVSGVLLMALQCRPIDLWNHYFRAKCIPRVKAFTIWGILTILSDFAILVLPVSKVLKLNLQRREKIVIIGIFSTGAIVCFTSIMRVITLNDVIVAVDKLYVVGPVSLWSLVEVNLGLAVSCLPALKHLMSGHNTSYLPSFVHRSIRWGGPRRDSATKKGGDTSLFKDTTVFGSATTGSGLKSSVDTSTSGGSEKCVTSEMGTANGKSRLGTVTERDEERGLGIC